MFVDEAVEKLKSLVPYWSLIRKAFGEDVAMTKVLMRVEVAPLPLMVEVAVPPTNNEPKSEKTVDDAPAEKI